MRILFLSQRVPYPPNRGDKITTWRLIERFGRNHEVRCVAFAHDEADVAAAAELTAKGYRTEAVPLNVGRAKLRSLPLLLGKKALTLGVFGSKDLQAIVDREAREADLAYAYSSSMGAFLEPHPRLARVMHFAELDSDKWRQYADRSKPPMSWVYRREWRTLEAFERRLAESFSENIFCTPLEEKIFQERMPGCSSMVLRNGVDLTHLQPAPDSAEPEHLVFVGVMDYLPNIDGCVHFVEEILPRVRAKHPDARFTIVGSRPTPEVEALGRVDGVEVTGFVDDPKDYLRRAAVSVAPLRIARGIQNKVLEAMAMGLPVVGTTSATQGIEGEAGRDFLLANTADEQATAIVELLDDPTRAKALGAQARRFVEEQYDWEAVLAPAEALLDRLVPASPVG